MRLTEAGQAFLPYARQVLAATRDGIAAVRALEEEEQGTIMLALVGTLASTRLTSQLQAFREAYPGTRLLLRTARSDEVSALVQQGEALMGLRYFVDPHAEICSLPVLDESLQVVSATHSRFVTGDPTEPAALRGVPWIGFPRSVGSSGEAFARVLVQQLVGHGLDDAPMMVIDSLTAQKRLIEADFGVGLLPASSVEEELRLLPIAALQTTVPVMLIHRRQAYLSRAARCLLEKLTQAQNINVSRPENV